MATRKKKPSSKKRGSKKKKPSAPTYSLPTERSTPSVNLWDYILFMFGEKKIGKTTMLSHAGDAFYACFEPGTKALAVYEEPMTSWIKWRKYVDLLCNDDKFNPVVIDTGDKAYDSCMDYSCRKLGIQHPSDEDYGKGWNAVKTEFTRQINKLALAGKGIVIVSHAKITKIKDRAGNTYDVLTSTLPGQASDVIDSLADIWCYYRYARDGSRVLQIVGDVHTAAGHRLSGHEPGSIPHFNYPDGTPIKSIPMGTSSGEAWENFVKAFNNELPKPTKGGTKKKKVRRKKS